VLRITRVNINSSNTLASGANRLFSDSTGAAPMAKNKTDKDTFMTLLVAQLKNQDPLEPQDGTQFVAQLAQFNSLEQLVNINDRLKELVNKQAASQSADISSVISSVAK
jgi:flagellar basal-body rod modification protein FlgD